MAAFVVYDPATGIIASAWRCTDPASLNTLMTLNTPAGMQALSADESNDAVIHPAAWKVVNGALQPKTLATLAVSGSTITVTPAAVMQLLVGGTPVTTAADGTATVPAGLASPLVVQVSGSDPNYWSAPLFA